MRSIRFVSWLAVSVASLALLTCTEQQSPFNPSDATVTPELENSTGQTNGASISDSVGKPVTITLTAYLPSYIDSVKVTVYSAADTDTVHVFDKTTAWTQAQSVTITFRSAGTRTVSAVVFAGGTEKTVTATIVIAGIPTPNSPPILNVSGVRNIIPAQTCSLSLSVQDPDAGQTHAFFLVKGPQGATLTGAIFKWTPPSSFIGTDSAVFSVTDNGIPPLSDTVRAAITVSAVISLPAQVQGVTGVSRANGTFKFKWNKVDNADGYIIYRSQISSGGFQVVDTLSDTAFSDNISSSSYYYYVTAFNTKGASTPSSQVYSWSVNAPPQWPHDTIHVSINEGTSLSLNLADSAKDANGDTITFQLQNGSPANDSLAGAVWKYSPSYSDKGTYNVVVTASDGVAGSPLVIVLTVVNVDRPPEPQPQNVSTGRNTPLSVTLSAPDPDGDQIAAWRIDTQTTHGTIILSDSTKSNAVYTPANNFIGADYFTFQAFDGSRWSIFSAKVSIRVDTSKSAPKITQSLVSQTVNRGDSVVFTVGVNTDVFPAPLYSWYKNDVLLISNNFNTYRKTGATPDDSGYYKVVVTNTAGADSSGARLSVRVGPVFETRLPATTTIISGATASLSVEVAAGVVPAPAYQWYLNGVAIQGAVAKQYSKTWAASDAGYYHVIASNAAGRDSTGTMVTVDVAPVLSTKLNATTTVTQGTATPLSVDIAAGAVPAPSWQWYFNDAVIPGATSKQYSKTWTGADAGSYYVIASNAAGRDSSGTKLVVNVPPVLSTKLAATISINQGSALTLTVDTVPGAYPAPAFQWYYNGAAIQGATSRQYTKSWVVADAGTYKVVVSNSVGRDSSSSQLSVNLGPALSVKLPAVTYVNVGASTALTVDTVPGVSPVPVFQWYFNGTAIQGAISKQYSKTWSAADTGIYKVVVSNNAGMDSSSTHLRLYLAPTLSVRLSATTAVNPGSTVALAVDTASGANPAPTFQWYFNGVSISGATSKQYSKAWQSSDNGTYKVVVSNSAGKDSSVTTLTVNVAPRITVPLLATTSVKAGNTLSLSVTIAAGAIPTPTYQWYYNGASIPNASGGSYSKTCSSADGGVYKVVVSNSAGSDSSSTQVTILVPPAIQVHPQSQSRDKGGSVVFSVTINSDVYPAPTYAWFKQGSGTVLGTNATYQKTALAYADAGQYRVAVTNSAGTDTSNWAALTVNDVTPPVITLTGAADTTLPLNATWTDPGATAADDKDGNISTRIAKSGTVNTGVVGRTTITYSVSDAAGNAAVQKTRVVRVEGWELVNNTGIAVANYLGFSMKLANSNLYIAYVDIDDHKTYIKKLNGNSWDIVGGGPVDGLPANMLSLGVSADGTTPYLGYVSTQTNTATIVSRLQGGTWQTIFTSQYDYAWSNFADLSISPTGSIYLLDDLVPAGFSGPQVTSFMKYNTVTGQMVSTDTIGGALYRNYYQEEKDYHVLVFSSDGTPYITYRGPGGFTIKKKSGTSWVGAGLTAADSVFDVAYSAPLQTVFSNNNLFVLVSDGGANPTVYNLKSGIWTSYGTITTSGSRQPCLNAVGDTCYVSYASYPDYTSSSVYVRKIINGVIKNVPETSPNGLAISGTFNYSWVEAGPGIVYAAGRDESTGVIYLMKYVKQ
jgi:hypothetical protein